MPSWPRRSVTAWSRGRNENRRDGDYLDIPAYRGILGNRHGHVLLETAMTDHELQRQTKIVRENTTEILQIIEEHVQRLANKNNDIAMSVCANLATTLIAICLVQTEMRGRDVKQFMEVVMDDLELKFEQMNGGFQEAAKNMH